MAANFFFATVVKVKGDAKDHDYAGDVQIRVDVDQDDKKGLKDEDLRWARCIYPVTHPQHKGLGRGGSAIIPGCRVFGFFVDADRQIPMVTGTMNTIGKYGSHKFQEENSSHVLGYTTKKQAEEYDKGERLAKTSDKSWKPKKDQDATKYYDVDDTKEARKRVTEEENSWEDFAKGEETGEGKAKDPEHPHMGIKKEPDDQVPDMVKYAKQLNPENKGGFPSTYPSLESLKQKMEGTVEELLGGGNLGMNDMLGSMMGGNMSGMLGNVSGMLKGLTGMMGGGGGGGGTGNSGGSTVIGPTGGTGRSDGSTVIGPTGGTGNSGGDYVNVGLGSRVYTLAEIQTLFNSSFFDPIEMGPMQTALVNCVIKIVQYNNAGDINWMFAIVNDYELNGYLSDEEVDNLAALIDKYMTMPMSTTMNIRQLLIVSNCVDKIKHIVKMSNVTYSLFDPQPDVASLVAQIAVIAQRVAAELNAPDLMIFKSVDELIDKIELKLQDRIG